MKDKEILNIYKSMVKFLSAVCGPSCEIILHDVSNPDNSVIAIENGHLSGRKIGDSLTDLSLKIIESKEYQEHSFNSNYSSLGKGKQFLSSTFYIKNKDKLIGLLCINKDTSTLNEFVSLFNELKQQYNLCEEKTSDIKESLDTSVTAILQDMISTSIAETGILPDRLKVKEKIIIIEKLLEQGILDMKGAISEIAKQLLISEPTVYRYIKSIKKKKEKYF